LLRDNVIADNRVAVHIDDAGRTGGEPARLEHNTIAVNQIGVLLFPSADSVFTDNGFVENTTQVALGGTGYTQAVWTVNGVGNYWSDYGGFDAAGDGTGDLAYEKSGRTSRLIAEDPVLLALASGPAFRLLSAVEERWAPSDPLVLDEAPQVSLASPPLAADRIGARAPLWAPGLVLTAGCGWLLVRARRHRGGATA
jgi:nitrous oxidase accessory protein NosD